MADLEGLADDMLHCRTVGHSWDAFHPMRKPPAFGELMAWLCVRCQTERHDVVSWVDGTLVSREYRHPEGYQLSERYQRADFRLAVLRRRHPRRRRAAR